MNILGERIIEYLKTDATLVALLDDVNSIFAKNLPLTKKKYVVVPTGVGEDLNNLPAQRGVLDLECVVSRTEVQAPARCVEIAKRVDFLLNKKENILSDATWKVIHFIREPNPNGLELDSSEKNEFFYTLSYEFILGEWT